MNSLSPTAVRLVLAAMSACSIAAPARSATTDELEARLQVLDAQMTALRQELAALKAQSLPAQPTPSVTGSPTAALPPVATQSAPLSWFGYGEINYSRPRNDASAAVADVGRFVLGTAYRFSDRTRFVSELEIEHAVSSAEDPGEVEVEQAYIEHQFNDSLSLRAGLFLMPVGLLNESHEPTRYFGVSRNLVETAIIPSTWREGGIMLSGDTASGLHWNVGLTTGFDLNKWDSTASEGLESPLASIHQELALARAANLAGVGAVNWQGQPGWLVGASVFTGNATQHSPGAPAGRVSLWEGHARWTPGPFEVSALYARGHISDTARLNTPMVGNPVLIPSDFYGAFIEGAWRAVQRDSYSLTPFLRVERLNTARNYASIAPGLTPLPAAADTVWTGGLSWVLDGGVVFKADYRDVRRGADRDVFSLGAGYQF
jgi:hypothetical protein